MTTSTLIPTEDQTQLMLESPMTDAELSQLEKIESRGREHARTETISKIERAMCLLEVYNDKLFRGKAGGRAWGQYLQSIDLAKLGFVNGMDTEGATDWMNFGALCEAIDDWNEANPSRPPLPYPGGPSYMKGWALLFDRERQPSGVQAMASYAPITGAANALNTWKTAVLKNGGDALKLSETRAIGRAARDAGLGRSALAPSDNSSNLVPGGPTRRGPQESTPEPEPVYEQRTSSAADRMQAAADKLEREQRQAAKAAEEKSLREDGIDPRLISTVEKESDFDAMSECETYSVLLGKLHTNLQTTEVWVRGRLNQYGSEGMDYLRQLDAGLYTISSDIKTLYSYRDRLDALIELLEDDVEAGSLSADFQQEPTN